MCWKCFWSTNSDCFSKTHQKVVETRPLTFFNEKVTDEEYQLVQILQRALVNQNQRSHSNSAINSVTRAVFEDDKQAAKRQAISYYMKQLDFFNQSEIKPPEEYQANSYFNLGLAHSEL